MNSIAHINKTTNRSAYILSKLAEGRQRTELAKDFGHKNYHALDMYMRRHGYRWDSDRDTYILKDSKINLYEFSSDKVTSGKVGQIIALFDQGFDVKEVATKLLFTSHHSVATYMKQKGYEWLQEKKNYVPIIGKVSGKELLPSIPIEKKGIPDSSFVKQVPRYLIPGIVKNKTITISHLLDQLIIDFSKAHNLKQKEIIEVALLDFFQKYGYVDEVNTLLKR